MKHIALGAIVICLASLLAEDAALAQAGSTGGIVGKQNKDASGGAEAITPNSPKTRSTLTLRQTPALLLMSAFTSKADIDQRLRRVRFVPKGGISS